MSSYQSPYDRILQKHAEIGSRSSNLSNLMKLLATAGVGYAGYKAYQKHNEQNKMIEELLKQQAASKSRRRALLGGAALTGAGAAAAAHFGLPEGVAEKLNAASAKISDAVPEKLKALFGKAEKLKEATSPAAAESSPAAAAAPAAAMEKAAPKTPGHQKLLTALKKRLGAGIDAVKSGKDYGEVSKAFGMPAIDHPSGPYRYGHTEGTKDFLFNKATGKLVYDEPGMVLSKKLDVTKPNTVGFTHQVANRPYGHLPAHLQVKALLMKLGLPLGKGLTAEEQEKTFTDLLSGKFTGPKRFEYAQAIKALKESSPETALAYKKGMAGISAIHRGREYLPEGKGLYDRIIDALTPTPKKILVGPDYEPRK